MSFIDKISVLERDIDNILKQYGGDTVKKDTTKNNIVDSSYFVRSDVSSALHGAFVSGEQQLNQTSSFGNKTQIKTDTNDSLSGLLSNLFKF